MPTADQAPRPASRALAAEVTKKVRERGLIVWVDAERQYTGLVAALRGVAFGFSAIDDKGSAGGDEANLPVRPRTFPDRRAASPARPASLPAREILGVFRGTSSRPAERAVPLRPDGRRASSKKSRFCA